MYAIQFVSSTPLTDWWLLPGADASGIRQRPEEIEFVDINGDDTARTPRSSVTPAPAATTAIVPKERSPSVPFWVG
ncbi:hypothetical protein PG985_008615 [Apiospora marii]|uniref:Uncharacterized protein n=1 Tax=Apiospora marii TaxID=335849 RepID=A0ABR1R3Q9_9PEZI